MKWNKFEDGNKPQVEGDYLVTVCYPDSEYSDVIVLRWEFRLIYEDENEGKVIYRKVAYFDECDGYVAAWAEMPEPYEDS